MLEFSWVVVGMMVGLGTFTVMFTVVMTAVMLARRADQCAGEPED